MGSDLLVVMVSFSIGVLLFCVTTTAGSVVTWHEMHHLESKRENDNMTTWEFQSYSGNALHFKCAVWAFKYQLILRRQAHCGNSLFLSYSTKTKAFYPSTSPFNFTNASKFKKTESFFQTFCNSYYKVTFIVLKHVS